MTPTEDTVISWVSLAVAAFMLLVLVANITRALAS